MQTKTKVKSIHSRTFLNKDRGLAAIDISFDIWPYGGGFYSEVIISDCNRSVTLDFNVNTKKQFDERYKKLDLLIRELKKLQDHMATNAEAIKQEMGERNSRPKKNKLSILEDLLED